MKNLKLKENETFSADDPLAFMSLLDEADGLIYQFQYFPDENCFRVPFASSGITNIYELEAEEVKNDATPIFKRIHRDDIESVKTLINESIQLMESRTFQYRVVLPSKGVRWVKGHARPVKTEDGSYFWNGCMMDVTDQKQLELELFESKQRLQLAIESSGDNIWDWDVINNKIIYSDESKKMFGYEPNDLGPGIETWISIVHPKDIKSFYDCMRRYSTGEEEHYNSKYRIRCKNGNYKWILDRGKAIERDKNGNMIRMVGTHSDITLQMQKEEETGNTIDVIGEQNNRLLNFAHIVSHNLRSHAGNLKMLMKIMNNSNNPQEKEEVLYHLNNVSNALSDTIEHLNDIVTIQTNIDEELKKIKLSRYIQKTLNVLKADIDQNEATIINNVPKEVTIEYNAAYMESILLNLISNTMKYKHPDRKPEARIEVFYENERLVLKISDNGLGIDLSKYGEDLFGMYKTFHDNKDAVGIGLFITKNQVEALGGKIEVSSEVNAGTSFKVTF